MTAHLVARTLAALIVAASAAGCAAPLPERNPAPLDAKTGATADGVPEARTWGDAPPTEWAPDVQLTRDELIAYAPALFGTRHEYLALSGGGPDGAFGAGLLVGWTEHGDRPEFELVTGVSTGALTAPFAFLGPKYDEALREIYTTYTTEDLVERRGILEIFTGDSVADVTRFAELIARYIDDDVVAEIAQEHRRGRRLWIGTTDLDAARPVLWDLGRIATSGHPNAKSLIHKVLRASASIPGAFPPVYFEIDKDGRVYDEIHVDGGTTSQVVLYPSNLDFTAFLDLYEVEGRPDVYIVRNSALQAPADPVDPAGIFSILGKSVSSLIRTSGIGDLTTLYFSAQRDGLDYNLAYVPDDFAARPAEPFDQEYMTELFELGRQLAALGYEWRSRPPSLDAFSVDYLRQFGQGS